MMMKHSSSANNKLRPPSVILNLVIITAISLISWNFSSKFIAPNIETVPWGFVTILILPIGSWIALLNELSKVQKNVSDDISRSESRRLEYIVSSKQKASGCTLVFQLIVIAVNISIIFASSSLLLAPYKADMINALMSMMIVSLYLIIPAVLGIKEISDFETKVKRRKIDQAKTKKALSRLS